MPAQIDSGCALGKGQRHQRPVPLDRETGGREGRTEPDAGEGSLGRTNGGIWPDPQADLSRFSAQLHCQAGINGRHFLLATDFCANTTSLRKRRER